MAIAATSQMPSTRNGWRAQLRPRRYRNALIGFLLVGPHDAGRFAGSDDALTGGLAPAYSVRGKGEAGAFEVVGLERGYGRAHRLTKPIGRFEQFRPGCAVALADGDDAEHGVAGGGDRLDLEVGVDAVTEAAGALGLEDLQCFSRGSCGLAIVDRGADAASADPA